MAATCPDAFETPAEFGEGSVWVDRTGTRELVGHTQGGVQIPIGHGDGMVSPGELLKLALIGCAGMSMDHPTARRLGEDFALRIYAHGVSDPEEDRYLEVREQIQLDTPELEPRDRAALERIIDRTIDAACTIQRTVTRSAPVHHTFLDSSGSKETSA